MKRVLDASVALRWFFRDRADERDTDRAADLLKAYAGGQIELLAPPHFLAEVCAVLARESPQAMAAALQDLLDLGIPVHDDAAVYARAMALSAATGAHMFDTLYHAVALEEPAAVLITADEAYERKAAGYGRIELLSRSAALGA